MTSVSNHGSGDVAADNVGGTYYPCIKVSIGDPGTASAVSQTNPMPVAVVSGGGSSSGGLTDTELRASPVPISGTGGVIYASLIGYEY